MNDMTPAPISVERLREVVAIVNGPLLSCKANDHAAWEAVSFLQDQGLALLDQLAEMSADLEREQGVREDAQRQLRAAERAREEATGLLRELFKRVNRLPFNLASQVAAFLAASGGSDGR